MLAKTEFCHKKLRIDQRIARSKVSQQITLSQPSPIELDHFEEKAKNQTGKFAKDLAKLNLECKMRSVGGGATFRTSPRVSYLSGSDINGKLETSVIGRN